MLIFFRWGLCQTVTHKGTPSTEEVYELNANLSNEIQIGITFTRPQETPGFKIGEGADGGMSFFGTDAKKPDGFVIQSVVFFSYRDITRFSMLTVRICSRFHPVQVSTGHVILKGQAISAEGEVIFIHAIQGMQPNKVCTQT